MEIYVGCDSPSIIKYLELMTKDVFTIHFINYYFDESIFPKLGGEKEKQPIKEIIWNNLSYPIPHIEQCKLKV